MSEHEVLLQQHCEREETRNELGLAWVRQVIVTAVTIACIVGRFVPVVSVRLSNFALGLVLVAVVANLALIRWLRSQPPYHPARKYVIAGYDLILVTFCTQSVYVQTGALWLKMVPLLNFMLFILWGALRYSVPLVAFLGVEAILLYTTMVVPHMNPVDQGLVRVGASMHLSVATLTAMYLIRSLRSLTLETIVKQRQSQRKDIFVGGVSHELRQPLTAILGYSHLLADGMRGPLTEPQQATVKAIMGSADHLLVLINDLLDIASIEAGRMTLNVEELSIKQVLRQASLSIQPQCAAKGLELVTQVPDAEVWIDGDYTRLCQVFVNLLGNAVKYTQQGRIGYRVEPGDTRCQVVVWDTGPGIADTDLPKVFEEFWKGENGGTGLGLSITRRLVTLHGGDIRVDSQPGHGTQFTVELPQTSNR